MFRALKADQCLGQELVHELYPELVKRLDDSNDAVRIEVCNALTEFLQCAPADAYRGKWGEARLCYSCFECTRRRPLASLLEACVPPCPPDRHVHRVHCRHPTRTP